MIYPTRMEKITTALIESMIYVIRGQRVMLDTDLATLYGVETGNLNRQVRRNIDRFPEDFMFQITNEELRNLVCQIGISSSQHGGIRKLPLVFTENGVAMLSSVLRSPQAIQVNISIMRTFTRLKGHFMMALDLRDEFKEMKSDTNKVFKVVFERLESIEEVLDPKLPQRKKKIGLK